MKINHKGLDLIKHFEGFCPDAYYCPEGVLTIGYGTTGSRVKLGMSIDEKTAEQWLLEDVKKFADGVKSLVKVKLGSNQFSALVSFTYNVGLGAFKNSSLLRKLNISDYRGAAAEFDRWVRGSDKTLPGLVRRRNAEKALFLKPDSVAEGANKIEPFRSDRLRIIHPTFLKLKTCSHVKLQDNREKVAIPTGCEFPLLAYAEDKGHFKVTFGTRGSDIKFAGRNTWYLWHEHVEFVGVSATTVSKAKNLAEQVARVCAERGYSLKENEWNLVGINGLVPQSDHSSGYALDTTPDKWNDSIGVIAQKDGQWKFLCSYRGTTEPGRYYTRNPLNSNGGAQLAFGYHENLWKFGAHRGYEALVQAGKARLVRDTNKNFQRDDKETLEQGNGVNLHTTKTTGWRGSASKDSIGKWSAGCNVVLDPQEFKDLMSLLKRSPQYQLNPHACFDYRLLSHEWLQ